MNKRNYLYWINDDGSLKEGAPKNFVKMYEYDKAEYEKGLKHFITLQDDYRRKKSFTTYLVTEKLMNNEGNLF